MSENSKDIDWYVKKGSAVALIVILSALAMWSLSIGSGGNVSNDTVRTEPTDPDETKFQPPSKSSTSKYFVDTKGYTPEWAKEIGVHQISAKCSSFYDGYTKNEPTRDMQWCSEYTGYQLDMMSEQMDEDYEDLQEAMKLLDKFAP